MENGTQLLFRPLLQSRRSGPIGTHGTATGTRPTTAAVRYLTSILPFMPVEPTDVVVSQVLELIVVLCPSG